MFIARGIQLTAKPRRGDMTHVAPPGLGTVISLGSYKHAAPPERGCYYGTKVVVTMSDHSPVGWSRSM